MSHYYLHGDDTLDKSLAIHGFYRNDITDVILTHLHFDHCGGSIVRENNGKLVPAFKNAIYWSNSAHWDWAVKPNDREKASFLKENILPIQESGQLKFIPINNQQLSLINHPAPFSDNISIITMYGHTTAMMLPKITYKEKVIVYMADLLPSIHHIPIPYIMAYDMFPLTTLKEKKLFLEEAFKENYILYFEHDPIVECCNVKMTDKGIRMGSSFKLSEL